VTSKNQYLVTQLKNKTMRKLILNLIILSCLTLNVFAGNDTLVEAKIGINDVLIFNKSIINNSDSLYNEIINNKRLIIPYKENKVTIAWTSIDSIELSNYNFAFILEGIDKEWHYNYKDNKITFINLSPGQYRFKLKWAKDGVWTDTPDYLDITIIPPFWNTFWFKIISFFLVFGLLVLIIVYTRLRKNKKNN